MSHFSIDENFVRHRAAWCSRANSPGSGYFLGAGGSIMDECRGTERTLPKRPTAHPLFHSEDGAPVMNSDSSVVPNDSQHREVEQLLRAAQAGDAEPVGRLLALYRNYLLVLATTQFDRRLRRRVSPSDLVQDALLAAHRDFRQFNGQGERQFLAWLRQILINCLHRAVETHLKTKMRDMRCEISLDQVTAALDRSAVHLGDVLAATASSPSELLHAQERAVEIANQLARLRPRYREIIIMRNLQGLSFEEIAARLDRNPARCECCGCGPWTDSSRQRRQDPEMFDSRQVRSEPAASAEPSTLAGLSREQQLRLTEILDEYLRALEGGVPPAAEQVLAAHPDLAPALAPYLESLVGLHDVTAAFGGPAAEAAPPSDDGDEKRLGDFVLLEEIGRGGMGVVYEARQVSLSRRVALKVLPFASVLDARQIARFKNEAQAAAQLQHPNIVPVYAVGVERGVHYYAMQFIDGQPLDRAIAQLRSLEQLDAPARAETASMDAGGSRHEDRWTVRPHESFLSTAWSPRRQYFDVVMRLGIQVAEALHAAHSLGVVHRDIKPSNLLLDGSGKLWITDFGLARCQTDLSLTRTGDVVGTRQYMSPEQALGQAALVDQRTDVYSLGATLYELLTLRPAFEAEDGAALLRRIDREQSARIRSLQPLVPVDLETVVNKAMARERDERYLTAQDLADDLRRLLDGRPPLARRPTLLDRCGKLARRHRRAVVLGMAGAAVALVALSTALVLIQQAKRRAEHDYARAESYLRQAQDTVDLFGARFADRLGHVPGAEQVRREVLQETLAYYQRFVKQAGGNPDLRADLATTYGKIGSLNDQMGLSDEAIAAHQEAIGLLRELADAQPQVVEYRSQLAVAKNNLALALSHAGRSDEGRQALLDAISLQQQLVGEQPQVTRHRVELALSHNNLGAQLRDAGKVEQARAAFREAVRQGQRAVAAQPDDVAASRNLAAAYNNLAALNRGQDQDASVALYRQAADLQRQAVKTNPTELKYRSELATTLNNLGAAQARGNQLAAAVATYRDAIELQKDVLRIVPLDRTFRHDLAVTYNNLGLTHARLAEPESAQRCFRNALGFQEQLVAERPRDAELQSGLGGMHNNLGIVLEGWGRLEEAADSFAKAIEHQRVAMQSAPAIEQYRSYLGKHYSNHGRTLRALGRVDAAVQTALARKELWPQDPERLLSVAEELARAGTLQHAGPLANADRSAIRYVGDRHAEGSHGRGVGFASLEPERRLCRHQESSGFRRAGSWSCDQGVTSCKPHERPATGGRPASRGARWRSNPWQRALCCRPVGSVTCICRTACRTGHAGVDRARAIRNTGKARRLRADTRGLCRSGHSRRVVKSRSWRLMGSDCSAAECGLGLDGSAAAVVRFLGLLRSVARRACRRGQYVWHQLRAGAEHGADDHHRHSVGPDGRTHDLCCQRRAASTQSRA